MTLKKERSYYSHIPFTNETDNPNYEQRLMVESFIKSSNNLFKCEPDVIDDKPLLAKDILEPLRFKSELKKNSIDKNIRHENRNEDKVEHLNRFKRFLNFNEGANRNLLHEFKKLQRRRRDHSITTSRIYFPKERKHLVDDTDFFNEWRASWGLQRPQIGKFSRRFVTPNPELLNDILLSNIVNATKRPKSSGIETQIEPQNTIEKLFGLSDPTEDELIHPPEFLTKEENEKLKSGIKWICKRFIDIYTDPPCWRVNKRNRCKKRLTTICKKSVNDGKKWKNNLPPTHRCLRVGTCPCQAYYFKCPPQKCCKTEPIICVPSTDGRCKGLDTKQTTPPGDDLCPCRVKHGRRRRCKRKCSCDCGCDCRSGVERPHPQRASNVRGSCGCGCGCGCSHVGHSPRPNS